MCARHLVAPGADAFLTASAYLAKPAPILFIENINRFAEGPRKFWTADLWRLQHALETNLFLENFLHSLDIFCDKKKIFQQIFYL